MGGPPAGIRRRPRLAHMTTRAAVIGAGSWGTTVASLLAPRVSTVLWSRRPDVVADIAEGHGNQRYLAGFDLAGELEATADIAEAVSGADVVVVGVPTHGFRETLAAAVPAIGADVPVVSLAKGFEQGTRLRMTQVAAELLPGHPVGVLSGPNLARMLRYDPEWLGLPIIFLSSEEDREFQVDALAEGGDDFLTKPISDSLLLRAVTVRCYRARQLDKLVSRDSLTGLLKHSVIKSEVGKELARCQRLGQQSVVAMLDLDHFKQVNDCYGHRTGDLVIKGLANLLRHRLRKSDVIGRYGGEEFMVALPDCSVEQARVVFQSVCDLMSRISFTGGNKEFHVTLSVGVAPLEDYVSDDDAIEAADKALYSRKLSGRNGVTATSDESQPGKVGN